MICHRATTNHLKTILVNYLFIGNLFVVFEKCDPSFVRSYVSCDFCCFVSFTIIIYNTWYRGCINISTTTHTMMRPFGTCSQQSKRIYLFWKKGAPNANGLHLPTRTHSILSLLNCFLLRFLFDLWIFGARVQTSYLS